jgi:uncharacterized membrane protein
VAAYRTGRTKAALVANFAAFAHAALSSRDIVQCRGKLRKLSLEHCYAKVDHTVRAIRQ